MEWKIAADAPIYQQLSRQIRLGIVSGEYAPGERLPPVRELALAAGVNPNTMQRAMTELEREGLVFPQRTAGRFVTEDAELIAQARQTLARGRCQTACQGRYTQSWAFPSSFTRASMSSEIAPCA